MVGVKVVLELPPLLDSEVELLVELVLRLRMQLRMDQAVSSCSDSGHEQVLLEVLEYRSE